MFPFSIPLSSLKEFGLERENDELGKVEIKFLSSSEWEIVTPNLLSVEALRKLFYSLYQQLNYFFNHLDYQVRVKTNNFSLDNNKFKDYFSFIRAASFLWRNKPDLLFFFSAEDWLEFKFQLNTIYFYFPDQLALEQAKPKIIVLKQIMTKLGFTNLRFALKQKNSNSHEKPVIKNNSCSKSILLSTWKGRKIFELGVHTKFSTLDGISSPADYVTAAQQKKLRYFSRDRPL